MKYFTYLFVALGLVVGGATLTAYKNHPGQAADMRDQLVGSYTMHAKVYNMATGTPVPMDGYEDEPVEIIVKKHQDNKEEFELYESDELFCTAHHIREIPEGYAFDIKPRTVNESVSTKMKGYDFISAGDKKYQGVYFKATKTIKLAVEMSEGADMRAIFALDMKKK